MGNTETKINIEAYISTNNEDVTKSEIAGLIQSDIEKLTELIEVAEKQNHPVEEELMRFQKAVMIQAFDELSKLKVSTYRDEIVKLLERGDLSEQKKYFEENFDIKFVNDYDHYSRGTLVRAATVEVETADGYCIYLQKTETPGREIYDVVDPGQELFYNEPCEIEFLRGELETSATYYCTDDSNFFAAVIDEPSFIDELARDLCEIKADAFGVKYIDDINE